MSCRRSIKVRCDDKSKSEASDNLADVTSQSCYVKSESVDERRQFESNDVEKKDQTGHNERKHMSKDQMQAMKYLEEKRIFELFHFLIGHLLVDEPGDPIKYLYDLLDKCMLFRDGLVEPPLLFTPRHIESMFRSLDPAGLGSISLDQYRAGMATLGIRVFDPNPVECTPRRVSEQTFRDEAKVVPRGIIYVTEEIRLFASNVIHPLQRPVTSPLCDVSVRRQASRVIANFEPNQISFEGRLFA